MTYAELANPGVLRQPVYEPGKPIETVARELGLDPAGIIKMASNENPFGPSPKAVAAAQQALLQSQLYPDGGYLALRQRLAAHRGLAMDQFVIGAGSNEVIELLGHVFLAPGVECAMHQAAFIVYKLVALMFGAKPVEVPLGPGFRQDLGALLEAITPRTRLVFLASPANPVGTACSSAEIDDFIDRMPEHVVFVLDEAYSEYLENPPDIRRWIAQGKKVIGLRTFSKIYGLASLRIGYGYAHRDLIGLLQKVRQPFNVGGVSAAAALGALDDQEFVSLCRRRNRQGMSQLEKGFEKLGIEYVPGAGNFLLAKVGDGPAMFDALQRLGVITRPVKGYGLEEWLRVSVGTTSENCRVIECLGAVKLPSLR